MSRVTAHLPSDLGLTNSAPQRGSSGAVPRRSAGRAADKAMTADAPSPASVGARQTPVALADGPLEFPISSTQSVIASSAAMWTRDGADGRMSASRYDGVPATETRAPPPRKRLFTLDHLIAAVESDPDLPRARKSEMASAIRRVAAVLDPGAKDPRNIVAEGGAVRRRIAAITPDKFDVGKGRRDNIISLVRQAFDDYAPARTNTKWSARNLTMSRAGALWFEILKITKDDEGRKDDPFALMKGYASRFAKCCEAHDIAPQEVTSDLYAPFMAWNEETSWNAQHHSIGRASVRAYNKLIAVLQLSSCTLVDVPEEKAKPNAIPLDRFLESFGQDIDAYKAHCATLQGRGRSRTGYASQSIVTHERTIIWAAGLLVRAHEPIANITRIQDLLAGDRPRRVLKRLEQEEIARLQKKEAEGTLESGDEKPLTQLGMIKTLRTIATNWCRPTRALLDKLSALVAEARESTWRDPATGAEVVRHVKTVGLTRKNQRRLDQVTPRILIKLVQLPETVMARIDRQSAGRDPTELEALHYAAALAVRFELHKPDRVLDLTYLNLRRNFSAGIKSDRYDFRSKKTGRNRTIILKGKRRTGHSRFCERYREVLLGDRPDAGWLFPGGEKDGRMDERNLAQMVARMVERELGIKWNINLFRHFGATRFLKRHKGDLQGAADLCGNTPNTIYENYAKDRQEEAGDLFDDAIEADVADAQKMLAKRWRSR